ncbi:MAG: hypothetical protein Q7R52_04210 [archaeon]|nr:hypothetical protein [archaeon]
MLEKRVVIKNHFYRKFKQRAKNHFPRMRNNDITHKVANIMSRVNSLEGLFFYNETYFLPIKLDRNGDKPFYFLIKDDVEYFALISIYTEDMFLKRYGKKIK